MRHAALGGGPFCAEGDVELESDGASAIGFISRAAGPAEGLHVRGSDAPDARGLVAHAFIVQAPKGRDNSADRWFLRREEEASRLAAGTGKKAARATGNGKGARRAQIGTKKGPVVASARVRIPLAAGSAEGLHVRGGDPPDARGLVAHAFHHQGAARAGQPRSRLSTDEASGRNGNRRRPSGPSCSPTWPWFRSCSCWIGDGSRSCNRSRCPTRWAGRTRRRPARSRTRSAGCSEVRSP